MNVKDRVCNCEAVMVCMQNLAQLGVPPHLAGALVSRLQHL